MDNPAKTNKIRLKPSTVLNPSLFQAAAGFHYRSSCLGKVRHKNVRAAMVAIEKTKRPGVQFNGVLNLFRMLRKKG